MKFVISFFIIVMCVLPAMAETPPPPDSTSVGITFTHSKDVLNIGTTIGLPFDTEKINGYTAMTAQQTRIEGADKAVQRLFYTEVGLPIRMFEINAFVQALRNTQRDLDQQYNYGYFIHWIPAPTDKFQFSAGYGNFARNEIVETGDAAHTTFNHKFFIRLKSERNFSLLFEYLPAIDFETSEVYITPQLNWKISDKLSLNLLMSWVWDEDSHHQSITTLSWRF